MVWPCSVVGTGHTTGKGHRTTVVWPCSVVGLFILREGPRTTVVWCSVEGCPYSGKGQELHHTTVVLGPALSMSRGLYSYSGKGHRTTVVWPCSVVGTVLYTGRATELQWCGPALSMSRGLSILREGPQDYSSVALP